MKQHAKQLPIEFGNKRGQQDVQPAMIMGIKLKKRET